MTPAEQGVLTVLAGLGASLVRDCASVDPPDVRTLAARLRQTSRLVDAELTEDTVAALVAAAQPEGVPR